MNSLKIVCLSMSLMLTGTAWSQTAVCGNGKVEPGEQCDVGATRSGGDECDGCAIDCTASEECGVAACLDGIDNDGNSGVDAIDPKCATLAGLQTLALVTDETGKSSLQLRRNARVAVVDGFGGNAAAPYPLGTSNAEVCATQVQINGATVLGGSIVSTGALRFQQHDSAGIANELVLTSPSLLTIVQNPPLVGAPGGTCSSSGAPCLSRLDCSRKEECTGRAPLTATNPWVDLTGTGVGADEMQRCRDGLARLKQLADGILPTQPADGALELSGVGRRQTIYLKPGLNVLSYSAVHLGTRAVLQLEGPPDAIAVIQVASSMRLAAEARVEVGGGIEAKDILWNVAGRNPVDVAIGIKAQLVGTILAPDRAVRIKRAATVRGAVYARAALIQPYARVEHVPFAALLPADVDVAVTPDARGTTAPTIVHTVDVTNASFSWAPATTVTYAVEDDESFVSATPSQGHCIHDGSPVGGVVTCFLGAIPAQEQGHPGSATITIHTIAAN